MTQLKYFSQDVNKILGKYKIRIIHIWLSRVFWGILLYRIERSLFLIFQKSYSFLRIPFIPIINLIQSYSNLDIHYKANIKGGILVLHPSVGVVISAKSIIGNNLTLTGGNVIGTKDVVKDMKFEIGNNCYLGANATIIGPLKLGNNIKIGANACVVKSYEIDNISLVGVPAKQTNHNKD